ncbi:hypothetical protein NECAME_15197 [Necator americanus]|uniref:Uncharacterized protein n=1 Tax=Necator americanus TaxID=51031 RepID=W2SL91_NECAM|nr:hypothetical protein NECAME_15197 [Necator americanus]ETN69641.1 hypothetical protein NECAME_15197 [Necator americanus]
MIASGPLLDSAVLYRLGYATFPPSTEKLLGPKVSCFACNFGTCDSRGVGVLVKTNITVNIDSFEQLTTRIGRLRMRSCGPTPALTTFAVAYAPTSSYEKEEVEALYMDLEKFYRKNHIFCMVIIADFIAKLAPEERLEDFTSEPMAFNGCTRKAKSFKTTNRRLYPKTLELIGERGAARAAGNQEFTSKLTKLCREAIKEDLKERTAEVLAEAAELEKPLSLFFPLKTVNPYVKSYRSRSGVTLGVEIVNDQLVGACVLTRTPTPPTPLLSHVPQNSSSPKSYTAFSGWRRLVSVSPMTSYLNFLSCITRSSMATSDACVRALQVQIVILVLFCFGSPHDSCNPVLPGATVPGFPPESGDSFSLL